MIENIELQYLTFDDYKELKKLMIEAYSNITDSYWEEEQIQSLIDKFPEGQVVIKIDDQIAGCALSIIVDNKELIGNHTYKEITEQYTFDTHNDNGDILYGIDVFIKAEFRGLRLGRRLYDYRKELCEKLNLEGIAFYDYRKELCEKLNLEGIAFGGRIPNYHKYAKELSPKQYIEKVKRKEPCFEFSNVKRFSPSEDIERIFGRR